jgi:hypothetical protein
MVSLLARTIVVGAVIGCMPLTLSHGGREDFSHRGHKEHQGDRGDAQPQTTARARHPDRLGVLGVLSGLNLRALGGTSVVFAAQDAKVDVTGKWLFEVTTSAGSGTPTVTLKQDGEKLTGHYSSAQLGEADLTGSVKGREIAFAFKASVLDMSIDVSYAGTIEGTDAMKGKVSLGGLGDGTFTAKRQ